MRVLHWFRKDLRLEDNTALAAAAAASTEGVATCYISEPAVLARLDIAACRVELALQCLRSLRADLAAAGGRLIVRHGDADTTIPALARECGADAVYWNAEYEPALRERDARVERRLGELGIAARSFHDRLLVAPGAVATREGRPYTVFTPFARACEEIVVDEAAPRPARFLRLPRVATRELATAELLGFSTKVHVPRAGEADAKKRLIAFCGSKLWAYERGRDLLGDDGTTRLSADLKFGTISARTIVHTVRAAVRDTAKKRRDAAADSAAKLVSELRWRDFFSHVLWHFPRVETGAFRVECNKIRWNRDGRLFELWRSGRTGFPIVDAAMRQLHSTGWMHNRARMIVASFLTKDLGIDWRRGERHFMNELLDGDLANNNGGWQWAASTGTDAAPYFRIFNPVLQARRFDADGRFVAKWCPELAALPPPAIHAPWEASPLELESAGVRLGRDYPRPCADHSKARVESIARFEAAVKRRR